MDNGFPAELQITSDGSHTLKLVNFNEQYHSLHGALGESRHIFIKSGLNFLAPANEKINILEVGLGTGLNALLTAHNSIGGSSVVWYHALEPYPLSKEITDKLNFCKLIDWSLAPQVFEGIHSSIGNDYIKITEEFYMLTSHETLSEALLNERHYHLVYFDAFSPETQPELWTQEVFEKVYRSLVAEGVLVTYCSKGIVRRALTAAGFKVEKVPGPHGKREITRAIKI